MFWGNSRDIFKYYFKLILLTDFQLGMAFDFKGFFFKCFMYHDISQNNVFKGPEQFSTTVSPWKVSRYLD